MVRTAGQCAAQSASMRRVLDRYINRVDFALITYLELDIEDVGQHQRKLEDDRRPFGDQVRESAVSRQRRSRQPSAVRRQPSAVCRQPSAGDAHSRPELTRDLRPFPGAKYEAFTSRGPLIDSGELTYEKRV